MKKNVILTISLLGVILLSSCFFYLSATSKGRERGGTMEYEDVETGNNYKEHTDPQQEVPTIPHYQEEHVNNHVDEPTEDHKETEPNNQKETEKEEEKETITEHKDFYPYLTQCSMWNTQPPPARIPRWVKQYDNSCQRYLYVPFHIYGGFGHKSDNFMHGVMLSSALNYTYVIGNNFDYTGRHTSLSGAINRFGIGSYSPVTDTLSYVQKEVGYDNSLRTYEDIIRQAKKDNKCNTIYKVAEFYTGDRSPMRWHMAHMAQSRLATERTPNTSYDKDKFNIAVHLRYGSSSPYKLDNFLEVYNSNSSNTVRMIKLFTTELGRIKVPYAIHFFTAGKVDAIILKDFPGSVVHGKDMSVIDTIQHFMESDLLFCFVSSMCRAASFMSTRPLVINGYPTAESFFYNPCSRGMFCDLLNRTSEPDLTFRKRVREAGEKWLVSHRLHCPTVTEAWPAEDTSIPVSGPEQCDIWGPPRPPRMLFNPHPDTACPRYGYIPLDEEHSGSLTNVLRWVKGVGLSNLLGATFVFGGQSKALKEEVDLGLADEISMLPSLEEGGGGKLSTVDVPLSGVRSYNKALDKLEGLERKCGTVYKFEDPDISELGWTHLTLARAVQKHIIDTDWKPTLWTMKALNFVVDMSGNDDTLSMDWMFQSIGQMTNFLNRNANNPTQIVVIANKESDIAGKTRSKFKKYGKVKFVSKPKSVAEHVKHLVSAADLVFCPKLDGNECRIAALAGSRPGFVVRAEKEDGGLNFCAGGGMCSLVVGDRPITETNIAFVRGISERWNVGRFTKCL